MGWRSAPFADGCSSGQRRSRSRSGVHPRARVSALGLGLDPGSFALGSTARLLVDGLPRSRRIVLAYLFAYLCGLQLASTLSLFLVAPVPCPSARRQLPHCADKRHGGSFGTVGDRNHRLARFRHRYHQHSVSFVLMLQLR